MPDKKKRKLVLHTREELEDHLRTLANTPYTGERFPGACCYSPVRESLYKFVCPHCGMETDLLYPSEYVFDETQEVVKKLQKAGYDAYLYCTEFCPRCRSVSENTKREAEMQFVIRFSDSENYHVARSNILQDYLCVLEFLLGNEVMSGSFGETVPLNERVDVLVKMLGLTNVEAQQKIRNR